jgi:hypothetical protein
VSSVTLLGNGFQRRTPPVSRPRRMAAISRQPHTLTAGFIRYFLQLLAPGLDWLPTVNLQLKLSIIDRLPTAELTHNQSQSQSYFTTGGLPQLSSWCQAPWSSRPDFLLLQLNPYGHNPYITPFLTRGWVCLLWRVLAFVKCGYRTYNILLKILPFPLYTSPLSIQALESRSCLSYLYYATTAA